MSQFYLSIKGVRQGQFKGTPNLRNSNDWMTGTRFSMQVDVPYDQMVRGADVTLYLSLNQSGPAETEEQRVRAAAEKASCIGVAPRQAENSRCFLTRLEAFLHRLGLGRNLLRERTQFLALVPLPRTACANCNDENVARAAIKRWPVALICVIFATL